MKKFIVDSNVPLIATGQIGEAWAVVILDEIAKKNVQGLTDVFFLQEILDRFYFLNESYKGKKLCKAFRKIIGTTLPVTVQNFELSYELFKKSQARPRDLIHAAVMLESGVTDIFSVDGPEFDLIEGINPIHLPHLLQSLQLKGHYIDERIKQK